MEKLKKTSYLIFRLLIVIFLLDFEKPSYAILDADTVKNNLRVPLDSDKYERHSNVIQLITEQSRYVPVSKSLLPAKLTPGITLIAVHTGGDTVDLQHGDAQIAVKNQIEFILKRLKLDYVYEHVASLYPSYLSKSHSRILIDDDAAQRSYIIPELEGDHYIFVGGGFNECHYLAFAACVTQIKEGLKKSTTPIIIDMPEFAIYMNTIEDDDEGKYVASAALDKDSDFGKYIKFLEKLSFNFQVIRIDNHGIVLNKRDNPNPSLILRIIASSDLFLSLFPEEKQILGGLQDELGQLNSEYAIKSSI